MKKIIPEDAVLLPEQAERVFKGMIFDVYQWEQSLFDGSTHTFEMLKRTDTVSAVCIVDGKILMLDDEQPHLGSKKTFPGGRVDPDDESIESAAKREVLEETGCTFNNWRLVRVWQPYVKIEWFIHLWLATDVAEKGAANHDAGEKISMAEISFGELKDLIAAGEGHLGETAPLFNKLGSLENLLALPEFQGKEVDR
jgi:ADP-ribose pyrophosphatase